MTWTGSVALPPHGRQGLLGAPSGSPGGLVLFAHGSGSSRLSPRNRRVAQALQDAGFATLLFDLLTEDEAADRACVFDIALLADRLHQAATWAAGDSRTRGLSRGYFGASTGAAAALVAAARSDAPVRAVVSRGGRPDLAGPALALVRAPTLLIVGGADDVVLELNREAKAQMHCECRLTVVPGATHLFEEAGALEAVTTHAVDWFARHLVAGGKEGGHAVPGPG